MSRRSAGRAVAVLAVVATTAACGVAPPPPTATMDARAASGAPLPPLAAGPFLTEDDLAQALPQHAPWNSAIANYAVPPWTAPWCSDGGPSHLMADVDEPDDVRDGYWSSDAPSTGGGWLQLAVVRWRPADGGGLSSADQWHDLLREDAAACADDVALDPAGLPGERPLLTAAESSPGVWVVGAAIADGATGVRLSTGVEAASAQEAGAAVAGLLTMALGRVTASDEGAEGAR